MIKDVINLTKNGWNESNVFVCNDKVHISAENIEMNGVLKEDNQNAKLVNILKNEENKLINKIEKALNEENFGTYKNLISALTNISDIIDKKDWQIKHSEYETNGHKEVAIWEQDSNRNIRNYKNWTVKNKPNDKKIDGNVYTKEELITKIKNDKITVMSIDWSIMSGKKDNTCITIVNLRRNKEGSYDKAIIHTEEFNDTLREIISKIKHYYKIGNIDYILVDNRGFNIELYNKLKKEFNNDIVYGITSDCFYRNTNFNDYYYLENDKISEMMDKMHDDSVYTEFKITLSIINTFINKYMS